MLDLIFVLCTKNISLLKNITDRSLIFILCTIIFLFRFLYIGMKIYYLALNLQTKKIFVLKIEGKELFAAMLFLSSLLSSPWLFPLCLDCCLLGQVED